jgi:hypothetical protein
MKSDLFTPPAPSAQPLTAVDLRSCIQAHFGTGGEQYALPFEVPQRRD